MARALALAALLLCPAFALAQDEAAPDAPGDSAPAESDGEEEAIQLQAQDRIKAVSRKTFLKRFRFEAAPFAGVTTNDAFFRHHLVGARFSFHVMENVSVEVGGAWNAFTLDLEPINILRFNNSLLPERATLFGHAEVGATFTPLYGKFAFLNDHIINFDAFIAGGVGTIIEERPDIPLYPAVNIGAGARVFVLPWLVVRADLRNYAYAQQIQGISTIQNLLVFSLGVGFYFPFGFEYENQAFKVVDAG